MIISKLNAEPIHCCRTRRNKTSTMCVWGEGRQLWYLIGLKYWTGLRIPRQPIWPHWSTGIDDLVFFLHFCVYYSRLPLVFQQRLREVLSLLVSSNSHPFWALRSSSLAIPVENNHPVLPNDPRHFWLPNPSRPLGYYSPIRQAFYRKHNPDSASGSMQEPGIDDLSRRMGKLF